MLGVASKETPIVELEEIELTDSDGDNTWIGEYDQFNQTGEYVIRIYAENNGGSYSAASENNPNTTIVKQLAGISDSDGDGIADSEDAFPNDFSESEY